MKNVLLIGHMNSGKTTIINYLKDKYNYKMFSLGDGEKNLQFIYMRY